jgi:hypothetical protein
MVWTFFSGQTQDGIGSAWTWPYGLKASFKGHMLTHFEKTLWPRWPIDTSGLT